jgi:hypothetical protein
MSSVSTTIPFSIASQEREPLRERLGVILYILVLGLALIVLWAMGEMKAMEARTTKYLPPPADLPVLPQASNADLQQTGIE